MLASETNASDTMTERQLLIIKSSWSSVMQQPQEAGELFYQKLFEINPSLQALFKNDQELQTRKFISMMTVFVSKLQHTEELANVLDALAKRHVGYGAKVSHYPMVGKALLAVLAQQLDQRWNLETQQAWELMYQTVADSMIVASEAQSA